MTAIEAKTCDVDDCGSLEADVWLVRVPFSLHDVVLCDEHAGPMGALLAHGRWHRTDQQPEDALQALHAQPGPVQRALDQRAAIAAREARRAQRLRRADTST